jgi:hypothetical protein
MCPPSRSIFLPASECKGIKCISEDSSEIIFLLVENYQLTAPVGLSKKIANRESLEPSLLFFSLTLLPLLQDVEEESPLLSAHLVVHLLPTTRNAPRLVDAASRALPMMIYLFLACPDRRCMSVQAWLGSCHDTR